MYLDCLADPFFISALARKAQCAQMITRLCFKDQWFKESGWKERTRIVHVKDGFEHKNIKNPVVPKIYNVYNEEARERKLNILQGNIEA